MYIFPLDTCLFFKSIDMKLILIKNDIVTVSNVISPSCNKQIYYVCDASFKVYDSCHTNLYLHLCNAIEITYIQHISQLLFVI